MPLSGGTITGTISDASGRPIASATSNSQVTFCGGTRNEDGAWLALFGNDIDDLRARGFTLSNGNNISLAGLKDNSLTWGGKAVECVNAIGGNYIRYESGLQICWGTVYIPANSKSVEVLLPLPCKDAGHLPIGIYIAVVNGQGITVCTNTMGAANKFTIMCASQDNIYDWDRGCYWLDVGRWK